jgi:hypothetical protein
MKWHVEYRQLLVANLAVNKNLGKIKCQIIHKALSSSQETKYASIDVIYP